MKKLAVYVAFLLMPTAASAQGNLYLEGNIGAGFISDIEITDPDGKLSAGLGTAILFGAEAGLSEIGNTDNLRLGLSWDHLKAELDSVTVTGFGLPAGSVTISCSLLASEIGVSCSDLDETVNIFAANAYYDLAVGNAMGFQPFLGVGAGVATFEEAGSELALSGTLGARIPISMNAYVGGRYRFQYISGPTDDFGVEYDSITMHGLSVLFGLTF